MIVYVGWFVFVLLVFLFFVVFDYYYECEDGEFYCKVCYSVVVDDVGDFLLLIVFV